MKQDHKKEFARILSIMIIDKGIKKAWVAEMMGVSRATVTKWTSGITVPAYSDLIELARVLDVSPADFFTKKTRRTP